MIPKWASRSTGIRLARPLLQLLLSPLQTLLNTFLGMPRFLTLRRDTIVSDAIPPHSNRPNVTRSLIRVEKSFLQGARRIECHRLLRLLYPWKLFRRRRVFDEDEEKNLSVFLLKSHLPPRPSTSLPVLSSCVRVCMVAIIFGFSVFSGYSSPPQSPSLYLHLSTDWIVTVTTISSTICFDIDVTARRRRMDSLCLGVRLSLFPFCYKDWWSCNCMSKRTRAFFSFLAGVVVNTVPVAGKSTCTFFKSEFAWPMLISAYPVMWMTNMRGSIMQGSNSRDNKISSFYPSQMLLTLPSVGFGNFIFIKL